VRTKNLIFAFRYQRFWLKKRGYFTYLKPRISQILVIVRADPSRSTHSAFPFGYAKDSGRDSEIFLAFDDKASHNFIGISGNLYIDGKCNFQYFITMVHTRISKYLYLL